MSERLDSGPTTTPRPATGAGSAQPPARAESAPRAVVLVGSPTERSNPLTRDLDLMSTGDVVRMINKEDRTVADAVAAVLDPIVAAVDLAVAALRAGHRVHYFGAGTSGRLGVLDAAELPPTFNTPDGWFCAHLAGGPEAMSRAVEDAEDDTEAGDREAAACVRPGDVVVGLAASGRTPYVLGALRTGRAIGAGTVLLTADPGAAAAQDVDVFIGVGTGPEVVAGSTRMKAATAQKLVLNAFSTAVMVRLGRVYSNFMVAVVATNAKLRGRMIAILMEATGAGERACREALTRADGDLKAALVSLLSGAAVAEARAALARSDDQVRGALALLAG
jgi:N-acetylmuramic acid 6-phosphate etherase